MQIFISFADDARDAAREIASAIVAEGHRVWMRPESLPSGRSETERARAAIAAADLFVFVGSPQALAAGQITLSDLAVARAKWNNPRAGILPIVVGGTTKEQLPSFLVALDPVFPEGDLAADVATAIASRLQRSGRRNGWVWGAAATGLALLVAGLVYYAFQAGKEARIAAISQSIDVEIENPELLLSLGQVGKYRLYVNNPPDLDYACKAGPSKSPNIAKITHDARCSEIAVRITDGPVRGLDGKPYVWRQAEGIKLEPVPYVIEAEGRQVYRGQFTVYVRKPALIAGYEKGTTAAAGFMPNAAAGSGEEYVGVGFSRLSVPLPNVGIRGVMGGAINRGAEVFVSFDGKTFQPLKRGMSLDSPQTRTLVFELRRKGKPPTRVDKSARLREFLKDSISWYLRSHLRSEVFGCDAHFCAFEARHFLSLCHPYVKDVTLTVGGKSRKLDRSVCAREMEERDSKGLCASSIPLVAGETAKMSVELEDGTVIKRVLPIALKIRRYGSFSGAQCG